MDEDLFFFRGDTLPTQGEVFLFVNSRTKHGKSTKVSAINEAAKEIHDIWHNADVCPLANTVVIGRVEKLLKDRRLFLRRNLTPLAKVVSTPSDFTRKRRMPSTGRQSSKRSTCSKFKRQKPICAPELAAVDDEVDMLMSDLIDSIETMESQQSLSQPQRRNLRHDVTADQKWLREIGCQLFDVFSENEMKKRIAGGFAFDEEFLIDQRGARKLCMDRSKVTEEFVQNEAQRRERERRHRNYEASATMSHVFARIDSDNLEVEDGGQDDMSEALADLGQELYISAVKTRSAQSKELGSVLEGKCKRSISTQTEDCLFPTVSTRIYSKKNKGHSRRLNPRLLATGSLMMGVAGVSTNQAIMCIKIAANTMFHQSYILPPSLEKEYKKKLKLRKKLAKLDSARRSSSNSSEIANAQRDLADIVSAQGDEEVAEAPEIDPVSPNEEIGELIEVEEHGISASGKRAILSKMLCKPSTLRAAHHLISTLGEQEQALEMIESHSVNLIPDGTARQGGWGKMAGAIMKVGEKHRALRLQTLGSENHSSWVETLVHMLKRLATASGRDVMEIWKSIMVLVSDMCKVNMNLAADVAKHLGCTWKPGQAYCNLHPRLMMSRCIVEVWKRHQSRIGHDKLFPSLEYCNLDAANDSLVKQVLDAMMSLSSKQWAERSWNKYHEISEWLERKGLKNETGPLREIRFGELEAKALTGAYHLGHLEQFLEVHSEIRNKLTCFLRSAFPMREVILFYLVGAALIGIHIGEPYVNLLMVKKAKTTELIRIFPQLYKEMLNPPNSFTQLDKSALPCLEGAWIDPRDEVDPPYPKTQIEFLEKFLANTDKKYLELFCIEVSKEIAAGFKRQKGDVFGFGDGTHPELNISSQVPQEKLDDVETTSISVEQFFGEVDYKTKVSGGCQAKNKICDNLIIKHTEDLIQERLVKSNYNLKPLKQIAKEVDELQIQFDQRQKSLMAAGLREDEAVILSKESQVQRVVRLCKESHRGPIHTIAELDQLIVEKGEKGEKELAYALNLEIRYRKFTCLLKVATNNELFRQLGIDNRLRITHLRQLLTDDTKPKCHASMSDIEALYEVDCEQEQGISNLTERESENPPEQWFLNGGWPLKEQEQVIVLLEEGFSIGTVEQADDKTAILVLMKSLNFRGSSPFLHWTIDSAASPITVGRESILPLRPILETKGSRKRIHFQLMNLELIDQFIGSVMSQ